MNHNNLSLGFLWSVAVIHGCLLTAPWGVTKVEETASLCWFSWDSSCELSLLVVGEGICHVLLCRFNNAQDSRGATFSAASGCSKAAAKSGSLSLSSCFLWSALLCEIKKCVMSMVERSQYTLLLSGVLDHCVYFIDFMKPNVKKSGGISLSQSRHSWAVMTLVLGKRRSKVLQPFPQTAYPWCTYII